MPAVMLVVAALVLAQAPETGSSQPSAPTDNRVAPMPANPEGSGDVARSSGLEADVPDAGSVALDTPAEVEPALVTGSPDAGAAAPVEAVTGTAPVGLTIGLPQDEGVEGKISAELRLSDTLVSWFPVDEAGTYVGPRAFETRIRVAPEVHFSGFGALAEFDAATGAVYGNPPSGNLAEHVPVPGFTPLALRQLYLEYKWKTGLFRVGQQTSNWGLGLIANSGAHDAEAGDFGQARFGSLVYRALIAGRPLYSLGGNWRAVEAIVAADLVYSDDNAEFINGDRAFQGVLALRFKQDDEHYLGVYAVYRRQRAVGAIDGGRATDAFVFDVAGKWTFLEHADRGLSLGFEGAGVTGTTTQTQSDVAPVSRVRQFGAVAKAAYRYRQVKVMLDWGYASGDQNPYDDRIEGFRFDRDYKVGLVLFDQVLGYQSARAGFRAADPTLVGVPTEGVQLVPSQGSVYNAWFLFPRVKFSFADWVDLYGGPLFAFSTASLTDPYNTQVLGGTSHNYLGATPGGYLGTELDIGLQARWKPHRLLLVTATLEGGLLLPGSAFKQQDGTTMGPVGLGRLRLAIAL